MKHFITLVSIALLFLVGTRCEKSAPTQSGDPVLNPQSFQAKLNGSSVMPDSVTTPGGGWASFFFTESGLALRYRIQTWDIDNITGVYLHKITPSESHERQLQLADRESMQAVENGDQELNDELWAIDISSENLRGLHDQMAAGKAYLVVTTDEYPTGEIAGLIVPVQ